MGKNIKVMYSHKSDNWKTPKELYNFLIHECKYIDLFPYCSNLDQYEINYKNKRLFCNPPFSQMNQVVEYLLKQYDNGCDILLLVPCRSDTKWFHKLLSYRPHIYFISGRLHYNDSLRVAPFPSVFLYLDHKGVDLPVWSSIKIQGGCLIPILTL